MKRRSFLAMLGFAPVAAVAESKAKAQANALAHVDWDKLRAAGLKDLAAVEVLPMYDPRKGGWITAKSTRITDLSARDFKVIERRA